MVVITDQKRTVLLKCLCLAGILISMGIPAAYSEIITDGTIGPARNLSGPDYRVGAELGQLAGPNLFHSFSRFNLNSTESVHFTGPDTVRSVISRVTGGSASSIDGLFCSEIGRADIYFINPAGVVFGPNAQVDVPASFHVGTADEVRFADGSRFNAMAPSAGSLSAVSPESFGYLGNRSASLKVSGSVLTFVPGSIVSLSGGDVRIQGNGAIFSILSVPDGEIRISAVGDAVLDAPMTGEVHPGAGEFLIDQALLHTSGDSGGIIRIGAGKASVSSAMLSARNSGGLDFADLRNGSITLRVADTLEITSGGIITNDALSTGPAGKIEIEAGQLRIDGKGEGRFTGITSDSYLNASGDGGTVVLKVAEKLEVTNEGVISSDAYGLGNAGKIIIESKNLSVDGAGADEYTGITTQAYPGSFGNSGKIDITVSGLIEVLNGGSISSSTHSVGNAGGVQIKADDLRVDGKDTEYFTGIASTANPGSMGNAGTVSITVNDLSEVLNGGQIMSSTFGEGHAGNVQLETNRLRMDGRQGYNYTLITSSAETGSTGSAERVMIRVPGLMEILNGAQVLSSTFGEGSAGSVDIEAGSVRIDGTGSNRFTGIGSASAPFATGDAGAVLIRVADLLDIRNGGVISSDTWSPGKGGEVNVQCNSLRVDGGGGSKGTGIVSQTYEGDFGPAGTVTVQVADRLELLRGGDISSSTYGSGNAGNVDVNAGDILIDGQGAMGYTSVISASLGSASGFPGNVRIGAGHVSVINGGLISVETHQQVRDKLAEAPFTHITINSPLVEIHQGSRITTQSSGDIPAAAIHIEAERLLLSAGSGILTTSTEADGGAITLQTEILDLCDSLVTSSVTGSTGNGGNIGLIGMGAASALILEGGFIQANAPAGSRGGDIFIDASLLIPSSGVVDVGGVQRQFFQPGHGRNIIQAAAPGGEHGVVRITSPELDISGSLVGLDSRLLQPIRLTGDPCLMAKTENDEGGSLTSTNAGLRFSGHSLHITPFINLDRLEQMSDTEREKRRLQNDG